MPRPSKEEIGDGYLVRLLSVSDDAYPEIEELRSDQVETEDELIELVKKLLPMVNESTERHIEIY